MAKKTSWLHVTLILLTFTCTGLSVVQIGRWLSVWLDIERFSWQYWALWIGGLLPIYNVVILFFAAIFGKFRYFRDKQIRLWRKLTGKASKDSSE